MKGAAGSEKHSIFSERSEKRRTCRRFLVTRCWAYYSQTPSFHFIAPQVLWLSWLLSVVVLDELLFLEEEPPPPQAISRRLSSKTMRDLFMLYPFMAAKALA